MSVPAGGWGYGRWGTTMRWGIAQVGLSCQAAAIGTEINDMLTQSTPTLVVVDVAITIGGVDVSAYVESYSVELTGTGNGSTARASLFAGHGATITAGSTFVVTVTYTTPAGSTLSFTRFSGTVSASGETGSAEGSRYSIQAVDWSSVLRGARRRSRLAAYYNSNGCALELFYNGRRFGGSVSMARTTGFEITSYPTALGLIIGYANMRRPTLVYYRPDNVAMFRSYGVASAAPVAVSAEAQVDHKSVTADSGRLNQILVVMEVPSSVVSINDGRFTGYYTTGGLLVKDTADQAKWGVLATEARPTFTPTTAVGFDFGRSRLARSAATTYTWKAPINSLVYPTAVVSLELPDASTQSVIVESVTDSGEPGNHWSSVSARAIW